MNRIFAEIREPRFILGPCRKTEVILLVETNQHDCTIVLPPVSKMTDSLVTIVKNDESSNHVIIKVAGNETIRGYRDWRLWQSQESISLYPNHENWRDPTADTSELR